MAVYPQLVSVGHGPSEWGNVCFGGLLYRAACMAVHIHGHRALPKIPGGVKHEGRVMSAYRPRTGPRKAFGRASSVEKKKRVTAHNVLFLSCFISELDRLKS